MELSCAQQASTSMHYLIRLPAGCVLLQLLGELLLDRCNVRLMMRYVSDVKNLMQMMLLLKDSSRNIQFEAFHVFKVGGLCCACSACSAKAQVANASCCRASAHLTR
jgi:hypothetical protein